MSFFVFNYLQTNQQIEMLHSKQFFFLFFFIHVL